MKNERITNVKKMGSNESLPGLPSSLNRLSHNMILAEPVGEFPIEISEFTHKGKSVSKVFLDKYEEQMYYKL